MVSSSLVPRPSSKGVMNKAKWFAVRKPSTCCHISQSDCPAEIPRTYQTPEGGVLGRD